MPAAELLEPRERLRVQLRDQIEDLGLDVVHVGVLAEPHPIVVDRTLLELLERALDLRAHIRLALVPAHPHPVAPEVNRVPDGREILLHALRVLHERGERVRFDVPAQIVAQPNESA